MSESIATNRPVMKKSFNVSREQVSDLVINSTVANIAPAADKVKADVLQIAENIKTVADKNFVMMKNKKVWFDRNNAALYPKFEQFTLPTFKTKGQPSKNYSVDFEGFHFVGMTRREGLKSFTDLSGNPYKQSDGNFKNFATDNKQNVLTGELNGESVWYVHSNGLSSANGEDIYTLVPICRLNGKDSGCVSFLEAVLLWLKNGLLPEGLNADDENEFLRIMSEYKNFFAYLDVEKDELRFVEKISADFYSLVEEMKLAADKTFVMMKNKKVWFDRNNAAIYPKFEQFTLPQYKTKGQPSKNYSVDFEGFHFVGMMRREGLKSFTMLSGNPYKKDDGNFRNFSTPKNYNAYVLTGDLRPNGEGAYFITAYDIGYWNDDDILTLVPIHRLNGTNSERVSFVEAVLLWLKNGLVPEGLSAEVEKKYTDFMSRANIQAEVKKISNEVAQLKFSDAAIVLDDERFKADVLAKKFTDKISSFDFNIDSLSEEVMKGQDKLTVSPDQICDALINCDHKRANIQPYDERQLTDINRGHWELFEAATEGSVEFQLPANSFLVARPPAPKVQS